LVVRGYEINADLYINGDFAQTLAFTPDGELGYFQGFPTSNIITNKFLFYFTDEKPTSNSSRLVGLVGLVGLVASSSSHCWHFVHLLCINRTSAS
jgi:hypothetical protein